MIFHQDNETNGKPNKLWFDQRNDFLMISH